MYLCRLLQKMIAVLGSVLCHGNQEFDHFYIVDITVKYLHCFIHNCFLSAKHCNKMFHGSWEKMRLFARSNFSSHFPDEQGDQMRLWKNRPKCSPTHCLPKLFQNLYILGKTVAQKFWQLFLSAQSKQSQIGQNWHNPVTLSTSRPPKKSFQKCSSKEFSSLSSLGRVGSDADLPLGCRAS
jgi:hypothetical protein